MKPPVICSVSMCLCLTLASCGGEQETKPVPIEETRATATAAPSPSPTPAPTNTPVPTPVDLGEGLGYQPVKVTEGKGLEKGQKARLKLRMVEEQTGAVLYDGEFGLVAGIRQGIPGLDKAVRGMAAGEKRVITIPPDQAKLPTGIPMPGASGNHPVTAEVTLLEITPADGN